MAFFDEMSQKALNLANVATEKAKEAADSAKLTAAIISEQRELDKNCRAIGQWFVAEYEGEIPEAVADLVERAKQCQEKIAQLRQTRQKEEENAAGEKTCPLCGTVSDGKFCPQCGAPLGE